MKASFKTTIFGVLLVAPYLAAAAYLITASGLQHVLEVTNWFDPLFFQFNVIIACMMIGAVPLITVTYVHSMKAEKWRKFEREIPSAYFKTNEDRIRDRVESHFSIKNYIGSMTMLTLVVTIGVSIILLMKPSLFGVESATGVDFSRGANFLLLGPFIKLVEADVGSEIYVDRLVIRLIAFQFGFLGDYINFINVLIVKFFTMDINPESYVNGTVRMVTGSVLALLLSFVLPLDWISAGPASYSFLPAASFLFGFFPTRAFRLLDKLVSQRVGWITTTRRETPLGDLPGISMTHEIRLTQEGIDNVENLAHARVLDMTIRTGFGYTQLCEWQGRAWLWTHLGEDAARFETATGLLSLDELRNYLKKSGESEATINEMVQSLTEFPEIKIRTICHAALNQTRAN